MQPLQSGIISIPGSLKTRTWNQSPILAPKITGNLQKGAQSGFQQTPAIILKSVKIYTWTSKCLLGDPLDPSEDHQNGVPGTKNRTSRSPK